MRFEKSPNEQTSKRTNKRTEKNAIKIIIVEQTHSAVQCSTRIYSFRRFRFRFRFVFCCCFYFFFIRECCVLVTVCECNIENVFSLMAFFFSSSLSPGGCPTFKERKLQLKPSRRRCFESKNVKYVSKRATATVGTNEWNCCFRHIVTLATEWEMWMGSKCQLIAFFFSQLLAREEQNRFQCHLIKFHLRICDIMMVHIKIKQI